MNSWNGPLSAKQLVTIIVVLGLLVGAVFFTRAAARDTRHRDQEAACALHAPLGWDCQHYPAP